MVVKFGNQIFASTVSINNVALFDPGKGNFASGFWTVKSAILVLEVFTWESSCMQHSTNYNRPQQHIQFCWSQPTAFEWNAQSSYKAEGDSHQLSQAQYPYYSIFSQTTIYSSQPSSRSTFRWLASPHRGFDLTRKFWEFFVNCYN